MGVINVILNFLLDSFKKKETDKILLIIYFIKANISKVLLQHVIAIKRNINSILYISFFHINSLKSSVCFAFAAHVNLHLSHFQVLSRYVCPALDSRGLLKDCVQDNSKFDKLLLPIKLLVSLLPLHSPALLLFITPSIQWAPTVHRMVHLSLITTLRAGFG